MNFKIIILISILGFLTIFNRIVVFLIILLKNFRRIRYISFPHLEDMQHINFSFANLKIKNCKFRKKFGFRFCKWDI